MTRVRNTNETSRKKLRKKEKQKAESKGKTEKLAEDKTGNVSLLYSYSVLDMKKLRAGARAPDRYMFFTFKHCQICTLESQRYINGE